MLKKAESLYLSHVAVLLCGALCCHFFWQARNERLVEEASDSSHRHVILNRFAVNMSMELMKRNGNIERSDSIRNALVLGDIYKIAKWHRADVNKSEGEKPPYEIHCYTIRKFLKLDKPEGFQNVPGLNDVLIFMDKNGPNGLKEENVNLVIDFLKAEWSASQEWERESQESRSD